MVALGLKTPPWVQTRTITATVSVQDDGKVYSGTFTAAAQFTPKAPAVALQPLPPLKVDRPRSCSPHPHLPFFRLYHPNLFHYFTRQAHGSAT